MIGLVADFVRSHTDHELLGKPFAAPSSWSPSTMAIRSTATATLPPRSPPCSTSSTVTWRTYVESRILPQKRGLQQGETTDRRWREEGEPASGGGISRKRRPSRIIVPQGLVSFAGFEETEEGGSGERELAVEGDGYCLASKRGSKKVMEDGYGVITNINGDPKRAYFGVFDGHGGSAAVDFVSQTLGKNIVTAINEMEKVGQPPETAIRCGYLSTDEDFLAKNLGSGACAATVLLKDGEIHAANVGDCRIVMSRGGSARTLSTDHRPDSEEERGRIESSGGYVNCHNGVWRVQGSLSISRAIGDLHMKEWIISEPETTTQPLTSDCDFLIIASDGLWDKVTDQEAVDVVRRHRSGIESCKALVDVSSGRGCRDDITVMLVDLKRFATNEQEET